MAKFVSGTSGNPNGRPAATVTRDNLRQMIKDELPAIIRVVIDKALEGDMQAAKILIDRGLAPLKSQTDTVSFDIASNDKLSDVGQSIIDKLSRGDVSPDAANAVMSALTAQIKIIESTDLAERITKLEEANNG